MSKLNRKIPVDVLYSSIDFFDAYRMKWEGQMGTLFKGTKVNKHVVLQYGNTITLGVSPEYAPEIKHAAVFVADRLYKPGMDGYDYFKRCRINAGIF